MGTILMAAQDREATFYREKKNYDICDLPFTTSVTGFWTFFLKNT